MPKLGVEEGKLSPCPGRPNCVSSQATDASQYIEPIMIPAGRGDAGDVILNALGESSRVNVTEARDDYIHAEFTSLVFQAHMSLNRRMPPRCQELYNALLGLLREQDQSKL